MKWDRLAATLFLLLPHTCMALDENESQPTAGPAKLDLTYRGRRAYMSSAAPTPGNSQNEPGGWRRLNDSAHPGESILINEGKAFSAPVPVRDGDLGLVQAAAIASGIALLAERPILNEVRSHRGKSADQLARFGEAFGSNIPALILSGGYVYGLLTKDDGTKEITLLGLEASLATYIANSTLKHTFNRALPSDSSDPFASAKRAGTPSRAYPSTHASEAFSIATWIAEASKTRGGHPMIPILAYGAATITAWQRLYDNQHWASDVIAGALLGHLVTKAVMSQEQSNRSVEFVPYISGKSAGVMISYRDRRENNGPCGRRYEGETRVFACIFKAVNKREPTRAEVEEELSQRYELRHISWSAGESGMPYQHTISAMRDKEVKPQTRINLYGVEEEVPAAN